MTKTGVDNDFWQICAMWLRGEGVKDRVVCYGGREYLVSPCEFDAFSFTVITDGRKAHFGGDATIQLVQDYFKDPQSGMKIK